jgi:hypothetical protein
MKSTPVRPFRSILFTAFPPAPPIPKTASFGLNSKGVPLGPINGMGWVDSEDALEGPCGVDVGETGAVCAVCASERERNCAERSGNKKRERPNRAVNGRHRYMIPQKCVAMMCGGKVKPVEKERKKRFLTVEKGFLQSASGKRNSVVRWACANMRCGKGMRFSFGEKRGGNFGGKDTKKVLLRNHIGRLI